LELVKYTIIQKNELSKILVLAAHPDDETLGLGATIKKHSVNGDSVFLLIFADGESARVKSLSKIKRRKLEAMKAANVLGIKKINFLGYADQILDTVPVLEIAKHIETAIKNWKPESIYTHFWGDMNQDHRTIFEATLIATRPTPRSKIKKIICYETPSSTEWGNIKFKPNYFVDIQKFLKTKIKALKYYKKEIEIFPHPRSEKSIINRSQYWGSTIGKKNVEPFIVIRQIFD